MKHVIPLIVILTLTACGSSSEPPGPRVGLLDLPVFIEHVTLIGTAQSHADTACRVVGGC